MAPAELQDALLTMDVVDQLRYRNAEMKALADSGHDKATLKQRLLELYRSQGIEVSDEILEAGIQAQRSVGCHRAARLEAWLARRWIDRSRLLKWALMVALVLLMLGVLLVMARSFGAFVHESNVQKNVQVLNDKVAAQQQEAAAARALLAAQEQALQGLLPRATASGERLQPLTEGAQAALAEAQRRFADVPRDGNAADPCTQRQAHPAQQRWQRHRRAGTAQVEQHRLAAAQLLANARDTLPPLTERVNTSARPSRPASCWTPPTPLQRQHAWRRMPSRCAHAPTPAAMSHCAQAISPYRSGGSDPEGPDRQCRQLARSASAWPPAQGRWPRHRRHRRRPQALRACAGAGRPPDPGRDAGRSRAGPDEASQLVALLSQTLVYRIVNRDDERTGVWRYNEKRWPYYYLVTEALDEAGKATELLIRNEETGKDEWTSLFAVRVPEAPTAALPPTSRTTASSKTTRSAASRAAACRRGSACPPPVATSPNGDG